MFYYYLKRRPLPEGLLGTAEAMLGDRYVRPLVDVVRASRGFEPLVISERLQISIQAGPHNYSSPQELVPVHEYSKWEVSILLDGNMARLGRSVPQRGMVDPMFHDIWPIFLRSWGGEEVGSYVPTEDVETLFRHLLREEGYRKVTPEKRFNSKLRSSDGIPTVRINPTLFED